MLNLTNNSSNTQIELYKKQNNPYTTCCDPKCRWKEHQKLQKPFHASHQPAAWHHRTITATDSLDTDFLAKKIPKTTLNIIACYLEPKDFCNFRISCKTINETIKKMMKSEGFLKVQAIIDKKNFMQKKSNLSSNLQEKKYSLFDAKTKLADYYYKHHQKTFDISYFSANEILDPNRPKPVNVTDLQVWTQCQTFARAYVVAYTNYYHALAACNECVPTEWKLDHPKAGNCVDLCTDLKSKFKQACVNYLKQLYDIDQPESADFLAKKIPKTILNIIACYLEPKDFCNFRISCKTINETIKKMMESEGFLKVRVIIDKKNSMQKEIEVLRGVDAKGKRLNNGLILQLLEQTCLLAAQLIDTKTTFTNYYKQHVEDYSPFVNYNNQNDTDFFIFYSVANGIIDSIKPKNVTDPQIWTQCQTFARAYLVAYTNYNNALAAHTDAQNRLKECVTEWNQNHPKAGKYVDLCTDLKSQFKEARVNYLKQLGH